MLESENIYSCTEVWFWGTLSISFGLFLRFLLPLRVKQYFLLCCIFLHIYYSFRKTARLKSATVTICSTAKSAVCSVARRTTLAAATWCDLKFLYDFIRLSLHCFSSWMLGDIPLRTALFNSHHSISLVWNLDFGLGHWNTFILFFLSQVCCWVEMIVLLHGPAVALTGQPDRWPPVWFSFTYRGVHCQLNHCMKLQNKQNYYPTATVLNNVHEVF